jgi:predicted transcriptional regulator
MAAFGWGCDILTAALVSWVAWRHTWINASQMQRKGSKMKTSTIPSLRVAPELREAAESVLEDGETLSSFLEQSLRMQIDRRRAQKEFIERGLASRDAAKLSGEYYSADDVLKELDEILIDVEAQATK